MIFSRLFKLNYVKNYNFKILSVINYTNNKCNINIFFRSQSRLFTTNKEHSNAETSNKSIIFKDPTSLSYSLIEDSFNAAVEEYSEKIKNDKTDIINLPEFEGTTPALKFYNKNKNILLKNAKKIFIDQKLDMDLLYTNTDPVIRPPKNHLWEYNAVTTAERPEKIILNKGEMPTIETILKILEQEHLVDPVVVNLDECNRRDIGLYAIVATGKTFTHCRRVGRLLYRIFVDLEIPFVSHASYSWSSRNDQWIIAHLGPLQIYLMTQELRDYYNLEQLWTSAPEKNSDLIESDSNDGQIGYSETSLVASGNYEENTIERGDTETDIIYSEFKKHDDYG